MAAARAGVLGVRLLQRASRNMVPFGVRTGPREPARPQCGKGMLEVRCVGGRMDNAAAASGLGAEVELVYSGEKRVEGLAGPLKSRALASAATAA